MSAESYPDAMSADAAKQPDPVGGMFGFFGRVIASVAAGIALSMLGVPLWFGLIVAVVAACYLAASFGRFTRRRRREVAAAGGSGS